CVTTVATPAAFDFW
nr:immunoglobulin heavy chain junction region [Macaca mulatta]MOY22401.1 immunoglobulin heavy chain junction region [Macaca mulatta]MOY22967.1 immunoglobulin heavy chain junction region [Macaca mulatta]MOY22984.1 immunoglobulin heavy chain junction region [Macaca mulatta]MOY23519.1 immunoglobulin heavy chain junction region [Macaca mulatta]